MAGAMWCPEKDCGGLVARSGLAVLYWMLPTSCERVDERLP
jgi:hypothetical protein